MLRSETQKEGTVDAIDVPTGRRRRTGAMWAALALLAPAASHALPKPAMPADAIETTIALLGGLGLRAFVLDSRYVPSESMVPTLEVGDLLILEKVSFRTHPPAAGGVVCFRAPPALERGTPSGACYIKRVVAVAGDVVRVRDGRLEVNGSPSAEPYIKEPIRYRLRSTRVPEGHVYVLGYNRNNSYDSHEWGCLDRKLLIGRPICLFWPLHRVRSRQAFNKPPMPPRRFLRPSMPSWRPKAVLSWRPKAVLTPG